MNIPLSKYRDLLVRYVLPHRALFWAVGVLLCGNIGLTLVNPHILRHFIDTAKSGGRCRN